LAQKATQILPPVRKRRVNFELQSSFIYFTPVHLLLLSLLLSSGGGATSASAIFNSNQPAQYEPNGYHFSRSQTFAINSKPQ
jgi:hypothetical protein